MMFASFRKKKSTHATPLADSNAISDGAFADKLNAIFDLTTTRLQQHCGPLGKFAVMLSEVNSSSYTKDGVNIVRSLRLADRSDQALLNEIIFIGDTVERKVGDGTTTAMLFASTLGKTLTNATGTLRQVCSNYQTLHRHWDPLVTAVLDWAKRFTISRPQLAAFHQQVNGLERTEAEAEAIRSIAYAQSFCSSHGNQELSQAVGDFFAQLPEDAWPYITYRTEPAETVNRIRLDEGVRNTYRLQVTPFWAPAGGVSGDRLQGHRTALIIASASCPIHGHSSMESLDALMQAEREQHPHRLLVLLTPLPKDAPTSATLLELGKRHQAVIFAHNPEFQDGMFNELAGLIVTAGINVPRDLLTPVVIGEYHLENCGDTIVIHDIVSNPTRQLLHPLAPIPHSSVHEYLQAIQDRITKTENTTADIDRRDRFVRFYRQLYLKVKYTNTYQLVIGGNIHDITSTTDVLTDCIKASRSALRGGVQPGSNLALLLAVWGLQEQLAKSGTLTTAQGDVPTTLNPKYLVALLRAIEVSLLAVIEGLLSNATDECRAGGKQLLRELQTTISDAETTFPVGVYPVLPPEAIPFFTLDGDDRLSISFIRATGEFHELPLQSAELGNHMLDRTAEVILRLLVTDLAILT